MSPKHISFISWIYIFSVLISVIVEGSYFGFTAASATGTIAAEGTVVNQLSAIQQLAVGNLISVPSALISFTGGLFRILLWDYNFYYGGYELIRWFWLIIFSGAAVWGISTTFVPMFANFLRVK